MARLQIPSYIIPSRREVRGMKYAPPFTLGENKIVGTYNKRTDLSPPDLVGKGGLTHYGDAYSGTGVDYSKRFALPGAGLFDGLASPGTAYGGQNLTEENVKSRVTNMPPDILLYGDQFYEDPLYFPPNSQQAIWWYQRVKERGQQLGKPYRAFGQYGDTTTYTVKSWESGVLPTDNRYRKYYASSAMARTSCSYFNQMWNLRGTNVNAYAYNWSYAQEYYMKKHCMEVVRLGQTDQTDPLLNFCILFMWALIEGTSGRGYMHNLNLWEKDIAGGIYKQRRHMNWDFDFCVALIFAVGFCVGNGVIYWESATEGVDDTKMPPVNADNIWVGEGSAPSATNGAPAKPVSILDSLYVATAWYKACERTNGLPWVYLEYKIDDGPWITPAPDGATILEHAAAGATGSGSTLKLKGRGDCMGRFSGTAYDFYYFNPALGKHLSETVTVRFSNGKTFTNRIQGKTMGVFTETAS
ncbi:hypothetical protein ACFPMF_01660 [Larkinella bovis]|uniref:Uncharacterized protein n=1 Tax=Larkinella bovis TaxID=683041 RepID=A0ABW0I7A9_9BACT